MDKEQRNRRLKRLTEILVLRNVPFHPPPKKERIESMKKNNPTDYAYLMEFLLLQQEENFDK
jgi:hypothetical protein